MSFEAMGQEKENAIILDIVVGKRRINASPRPFASPRMGLIS